MLSTCFSGRNRGRRMKRVGSCSAFGAVATLLSAALIPSLSAQGLNWEGQSGAFITPFAYTSGSPAKGVGRPQLSFHYLDGGSVIGGLLQSSVTVGFLKRMEMGYTRTATLGGSTPELSSLFEGGFDTFHGKINFGSSGFLVGTRAQLLGIARCKTASCTARF